MNNLDLVPHCNLCYYVTAIIDITVTLGIDGMGSGERGEPTKVKRALPSTWTQETRLIKPKYQLKVKEIHFNSSKLQRLLKTYQKIEKKTKA